MRDQSNWNVNAVQGYGMHLGDLPRGERIKRVGNGCHGCGVVAEFRINVARTRIPSS